MISTEDRYEYIDLTYLINVAEGDESFVEETINTYLVSIPHEMNELKVAISTGNCDQAAFHAHTLKGAFNFVGASRLADMCSTLEDCCHTEDKKGKVPEIIEQIEPLAARATAELHTVLYRMKHD